MNAGVIAGAEQCFKQLKKISTTMTEALLYQAVENCQSAMRLRGMDVSLQQHVGLLLQIAEEISAFSQSLGFSEAWRNIIHFRLKYLSCLNEEGRLISPLIIDFA